MGSVKVTQKDLEQVMDLQSWLNRCDTVRKNKALNDAWAEGNTDCAFRINDEVGVQRSHAANDWNNWPGDLAQRYHDNGLNYGTYLDLQSEKMITEVLGQSEWVVTADRSQIVDNRKGKVDITRSTSAEEIETTVKEVTVSDSVSVGLEAGFEAFGADIKISATYEHTEAKLDGITTTKSYGEAGTFVVPAGGYVEVHTVKKECEKRYRVRVPIVMEGYVGLATAGDQNNWNTILPLTDPDDPDAKKGQSFVSKDQVTRWLAVDMNVASYTTEEVAHPEPVTLSVTKANMHEKLKAAKLLGRWA